ncbi:ARP5 [Hepatospora eriocheir]|uniref:ARP5 n=1 Tax=Hepatospora eriocheir TaxID=1081669 RepID=A0A1X0QKG1_9MICR|nr:ARP5 [Hepatospora eriocheir]
MIENTEIEYSSLFNKPKKRTNTIVIDNGTFECKAGFKDDLSIITRNVVYKLKTKSSFVPFSGSKRYSMFTYDIITNMEVFGTTLDTILEHLKPTKLDQLYMTITPYMPVLDQLIEFIFTNYKFNTITFEYDFLNIYYKYCKDNDGLIIDLSHKGVFVCYIKDKKIEYLQKLNFGGCDLLEIIKNYMEMRVVNKKKEYSGLVKYMRVSEDYLEESTGIYNELCNNNFIHNIELFDIKSISPNKENVKKIKLTENKETEIPEIDYDLLNSPDDTLDVDDLKFKKKQRMLFYSVLSRLKIKLRKKLDDLHKILEGMKDKIEMNKDPEAYTEKRKNNFKSLVRSLKERNLLRKFAKDKNTREYSIKNKSIGLTSDEQRIKERIMDAEDKEEEDILLKRIDNEAKEIKLLDPDFIPFFASTVDVLRGTTIGKECLNIELIKWPEIFFYPSIMRIGEMGLSEIIGNVCSDYEIENILLTGGLSNMPGIEQRVYNEAICRSKTGKLKIIKSENTQSDAFYFSGKSKLNFEINRSEWEEGKINNIDF